jgi:hypothetical protein
MNAELALAIALARIDEVEDRLKLSNHYLYKALVAYNIARGEMNTPLSDELHTLLAQNKLLLENR